MLSVYSIISDPVGYLRGQNTDPVFIEGQIRVILTQICNHQNKIRSSKKIESVSR